jgi:hypothetical protein
MLLFVVAPHDHKRLTSHRNINMTWLATARDQLECHLRNAQRWCATWAAWRWAMGLALMLLVAAAGWSWAFHEARQAQRAELQAQRASVQQAQERAAATARQQAEAMRTVLAQVPAPPDVRLFLHWATAALPPQGLALVSLQPGTADAPLAQAASAAASAPAWRRSVFVLRLRGQYLPFRDWLQQLMAQHPLLNVRQMNLRAQGEAQPVELDIDLHLEVLGRVQGAAPLPPPP